jgi:hypothetical protein
MSNSPQKKLWKKGNLEKAQGEIIEIEDAGHEVTRFTDVHWRIDGKIDVWPSSKKYMHLDGFWQVEHYQNINDIFKK